MNKQIEEIKKLAETLRLIDELQHDPNYTLSYQRAMCLNKIGYRKASDVISEILYAEQNIHGEYIHNSLSLSDEYKTGYLKATSDFLKMLFNLKKKYESEGEE